MSATFNSADRVRVKRTAGFHKGATGVITKIESSGKMCVPVVDVAWVLRDGASSSVWFHLHELELDLEEALA